MKPLAAMMSLALEVVVFAMVWRSVGVRVRRVERGAPATEAEDQWI